jgi:hypothetical protein
MEEISPTKQKILQYLDYKGISKAIFCRETGISYENFKGKSLKSDIGGAILGKIITIYSDISAEWLLTGEGSMLKPDTPTQATSNAVLPPSDNTLLVLLGKNEMLIRENERLRIELDRYRASDAVGGQS